MLQDTQLAQAREQYQQLQDESQAHALLQRIDDKISQENMVYPNILLIGPSGSGKSSLVNTVFGQKLAKV